MYINLARWREHICTKFGLCLSDIVRDGLHIKVVGLNGVTALSCLTER
jgi:hypothetical protein